MTTSRNVNQEKAMTIIYDALTYDHMGINYDITELISNVLKETYDDSDFYVKEVVIKALLHKEEIIAVIEPNLNKWKFNRLTRLAQAILLLSYAHFYYVKEVDKAVVIDIAVHLSKKFLDEDDYKFVNAVLDKIIL